MKMTESVESYCGIYTDTSLQHKDLRESSQQRHVTDLQKFLDWLEVHNPFGDRPDYLVSLSTGIVADSSVNCDKSFEIGSKELNKVNGCYLDIKLQRKARVIPLSAMKNTIRVRGEQIIVNPTQLLNRITCQLNSSSELLGYMAHELATQPASLFDKVSLWKTNKAALAQILANKVPLLYEQP